MIRKLWRGGSRGRGIRLPGPRLSLHSIECLWFWEGFAFIPIKQVAQKSVHSHSTHLAAVQCSRSPGQHNSSRSHQYRHAWPLLGCLLVAVGCCNMSAYTPAGLQPQQHKGTSSGSSFRACSRCHQLRRSWQAGCQLSAADCACGHKLCLNTSARHQQQRQQLGMH
jgi:hypothetical protein